MTTFLKRFRLWLGGLPTPRLLLVGYLTYMLVGWALLSLPWLQSTTLSLIDTLFIAASAVSTTGLVTVDPGQSFNLGGELVILILIQLGGLGYMTVGSIIAVTLRQRLSLAQSHALIGGFNLPVGFNLRRFVVELAAFTFAAELIGALILWIQFAGAGVERPIWNAIFHSVSAFCTAGFSLFPDSLERFRADVGVNFTIAALAYLGAIGFLVFSDLWENLTRQRKGLAFSTRVILVTTFAFSVFGTVLLMIFEPGIAALPADERTLAAFFQAMTSTTTVGFNTIPISALAPATILLAYLLMMFGASPAGTGGGLKSTTLATMLGLIICTLRGSREVNLFGHPLPSERIQIASATVMFYLLTLLVSIFILLLLETAPFQVLAFEAISALGTVGLSAGATGVLGTSGKLVIIALMFIGRVGILSFGLAIISRGRNGARRLDDSELTY